MNLVPLNHVESTLSYLDASRTQIAKLEAEVKAAKQALRDTALNGLKKSPNEDERLELATQLYWYYTEVAADDIRAVLGITRGQVRTYLPKIYVTTQCSKCRASIDVEPQSRSQLLELNRHKANVLCSSCEEAQARAREEWSREWHQKQAAQAKVIAHLKAMPYKAYLKTEHWQDVRRQMLRRAGFRCQLCNRNTVLNVHHRTYERRGEEDYNDLIVLCEDCHSKFHDKLGSQS